MDKIMRPMPPVDQMAFAFFVLSDMMNGIHLPLFRYKIIGVAAPAINPPCGLFEKAAGCGFDCRPVLHCFSNQHMPGRPLTAAPFAVVLTHLDRMCSVSNAESTTLYPLFAGP
jgi:hypothetical protein